MMHGEVLLVHMGRPIREDVRHLRSICNAKGEIDIRPAVFASVRRRPGNGSAGEAGVMRGAFKQVGTESRSLLGRKQGCLQYSAGIRSGHPETPRSLSARNAAPLNSCSSAGWSAPV